MYHTFYDSKAFVKERVNRTSKPIMWKHFTVNNTNNYQDFPLNHKNYNNTFHRTIKINPNEVERQNLGRFISPHFKINRKTSPV